MRLCLSCLLLLLSGCSKSEFPLATVAGRVTLNGEPLVDAHLLFKPIPAQGQIAGGPESIARTDTEGKFRLRTIDPDQDGAVAGRHRVQVVLPEEEQRNAGANLPEGSTPTGRLVYKIPARYRQGEGLYFDVPSEGTDSALLELTSP